MNPALRLRPEGVLVALRVRAGSAREGVVGPHGDRLKVAVRAAPEKGRANEAVLRLLAGLLGLDRRDLEIRSGPASPDKTVLVRSADPRALAERLSAILADQGAPR